MGYPQTLDDDDTWYVIYDTLHKSRLEPHHVSYVNKIKRELETVRNFSVSPGRWFFPVRWYCTETTNPAMTIVEIGDVTSARETQ